MIAAGQYDHTLTGNLLANILKTEWPDTPKFDLLTLNKRVNDGIIHIRFLDRSIGDSHMKKERLLYTDVIEEANKKYLICVKEGEWSPKRSSPDSKSVPSSFTANKATVSKTKKKRHSIMTQASLNALIQTLRNPPGSNPTPSNGPNTQPGSNHRDRKGKPIHKRNNTRVDRSQAHPWKKIPPAPGAPEQQTIQGQRWFWCGVCTRWNTSHTTANHIVGYKKSSGDKDKAKPRNATHAKKLELEVSAWQTEFDLDQLDPPALPVAALPDCMSLASVDCCEALMNDDDDCCDSVDCCKDTVDHYVFFTIWDMSPSDDSSSMDCSSTNSGNDDDDTDRTPPIPFDELRRILSPNNNEPTATNHNDSDHKDDDNEPCTCNTETKEKKTSTNNETVSICRPHKDDDSSTESEDNEDEYADMPPLVAQKLTPVVANKDLPSSASNKAEEQEKKKGKLSGSHAKTLYFDRWDDIDMWYGSDHSPTDQRTFSSVEANAAVHDKSFDSTKIKQEDEQDSDENAGGLDTTMDTQEGSLISHDNSSDLTHLKNLQEGLLDDSKPPALRRPEISPVTNPTPLRHHQFPTPATEALEQWTRGFVPRPRPRDPRISIEQEANTAKRDGMRYERAQYTVYALRHQEPELTVAVAYQRVKDEEWFVGWFIDGTRIPNHPNPAPVWPEMSVHSTPLPCLLRSRIMEHRPIDQKYDQFVSFLNQSNATPSPVNISDPPPVDLHSRSTACETLENMADESVSSTSFVDNSQLGALYVPTDTSETDDDSRTKKRSENPFAKYYACAAMVDLDDTTNLQGDDAAENEAELARHPDTMDELITSAADHLWFLYAEYSHAADPGLKDLLTLRIQNTRRMIRDMWYFILECEQTPGSPYEHAGLSLVHDVAYELTKCGPISPPWYNLDRPCLTVTPDRVSSNDSISTVTVDQDRSYPTDDHAKVYMAAFDMSYTESTRRGRPYVTPPRAPAPVDTTVDSRSLSRHMLRASFITLVVVVPSVLYLLPSPQPSTYATTVFTDGMASLMSSFGYYWMGTKTLFYGLWALLWSVLAHPSCQPAFFSWLSCWIVVLILLPKTISPVTGHPSPLFNSTSTPSVHHFRATLHPVPPPSSTLSSGGLWSVVSNGLAYAMSRRFPLIYIRLIVGSFCKLLHLDSFGSTHAAPPCAPVSTRPKRGKNTAFPLNHPRVKRKPSFRSVTSSPAQKRARMRQRMPRPIPLRRRATPYNNNNNNNSARTRFNPPMGTRSSVIPTNSYQRFHYNNRTSFTTPNRRNRNTDNHSPTRSEALRSNRQSSTPRQVFGLTAYLEELRSLNAFQVLGNTRNYDSWRYITPAGLEACLQDPMALRSAMPNDASYPIIWDSGASISITNNEIDFVGKIEPLPNFKVKGIANRMKAIGRGEVLWSILDSSGNIRQLRIPAFLVPKTSVRLLSTQSLLQTYDGEKIVQDGKTLVLTGLPEDTTRTQVTVVVNPQNNLPMSYGYNHEEVTKSSHALNTIVNETSEQNKNLSETQKELVRWHLRLGHLSFRRIQFIMRTGILAKTEQQRRLHTKAASLTDLPLCAACQYGKQKRRPSPGTLSSIVKDRRGITKAGNLYPGQCVSVDHFVCSTKGRLFTSRDKSKSSDLYMGGAIFVDHASGYTWIGFQSHLNTHETLRVKDSFELFCRDVGVVPLQYLTDNGSAFTSAKYTESLQNFAQTYRFAGVGAHHHAGIAERAIQTIMSIARTMMLHAAIQWPEMADPSLWPMAVAHATFLSNHVPSLDTGISPHDLFTRTRWEQRKFHDLHVWGCPVYVLDKAMADGKKLPRWKPRSTRGILMGLSTRHATTVPLVLNPNTGYITPQFHVVFDDWFSTIATSVEDLPDLTSHEWDRLFGDSHYQYIEDDDDLDYESPAPHDVLHHSDFGNKQTTVTRSIETHDPPSVLPSHSNSPGIYPLNTPGSAPGEKPVPLSEGVTPLSPSTPLSQRETVRTTPTKLPTIAEQPSPMTPSLPAPPSFEPSTPQREQPQSPHIPTPAPTPGPTMVSRRSGRTIRPPKRYVQDLCSFPASVQSSDLLPMMKASLSDPDTLSYDEAMRDKDLTKWQAAASKEIRELEEKGTWVEVQQSEATTRILPGTWVFKRKRTPDGEISKFKARYCVRGDLQESEQENYSPVVNWSTIRIVLTLSLILGWELACIDFNNAFVQATLNEPVWIHLPRGFRSSLKGTTCLRLVKSLYGLSSAPRLWYDHLIQALKEDGFQMSKHDQCLLYKENIIIFLWVDDCGVCAPTITLIDELVERLKKKGLSLEKEGNFTNYLGINFVRDEKTNSITMTQKGLINKVIDATNMQDCNPNWTPATQLALGSDPDGEPMKEKWQYSSIVGMLLYLATNTRPDIAFAVSQVARFNSNPKKSHAAAVKTIVRYLARTKDKGTIFTPTKDFKLDCYVDADFAGLHGREPQDNPVSAKSRTGYILSFCGCPLIWRSQLQSSVALSTLQAEYHALSQAMRSVIATRRVIEELLANLDLPFEKPTIFSEVFEDNTGAFYLATKQRLTPRTKHFNTYLHFFWEHVGDHPGGVKVSMVGTEEQRADYFTKCQTRELFEKCRKLNQGW